MKSLIIGASSGLGKALAYELAKNGIDLILVSSDKEDLKSLARHLSYLYNVKTYYFEADAKNAFEFSSTVIKKIIKHKDLTYIFFPIGFSAEYDNIEIPAYKAEEIININFISIAFICNFVLTNTRFRDLKNIVGIGSIAASRGRRKNIIYSASKVALHSFFQSLRHSCSDRINIQFYIPGYLTSQQSMYKKLFFRPASPNDLAKIIFKNLEKKFDFRFFPSYWTLIYCFVKKVPWLIFKKINY